MSVPAWHRTGDDQDDDDDDGGHGDAAHTITRNNAGSFQNVGRSWINGIQNTVLFQYFYEIMIVWTVFKNFFRFLIVAIYF